MAQTSMNVKPTDSLKELCVICQAQPYDLICTCGDKFDFTCIHSHVEQIGLEFEFVQNKVGETLLNLEQISEDDNYKNTEIIVENWKQKRIQDINNIAELALDKISERQEAYSSVGPLRVQYNTLCESSHRIVHEQLDLLIEFQRRVVEKSEELTNLSEIIRNEFDLDEQLKSKLNLCSNESTVILDRIEKIPAEKPQTVDDNHLTETNPAAAVVAAPASDPAADDDDEEEEDELEAGRTRNIQRRNPIILSANNDRSLATICSHKSQLLYNDNDENNQNPRLTFLSDFRQFHNKQFIDFSTNENDDPWVQDLAYSTKLQGYLILNSTCLRILSANTLQLTSFCEFPDRNMKRVACTENFLYLIVANDQTAQQSDEIVLFNYDKQKIICKTFADIVVTRRAQCISGEFSDIAVNNSEHILTTYRLPRREEVGILIYNISCDGQQWCLIKQLLLNECWRAELSYTPRIDWCEKLRVFALTEYVTGHLIMVDQTGQVKGETRLYSVQNQMDSPLNLSFSNDDYLCVRYPTSINIHRLDGDRF